MSRIAFIGAGSYTFTHRLLADVLTFESLRDSELAFMDVVPERLDAVRVIALQYLQDQGLGQQPLFTEDRRAALDGADFVINLVKIGFNEMAFMDLDVPKKFGLKQTIGDTCGVAGVFRALRAMPFCMELCGDVEAVGSDGAVILNYSNPQSMLVMATAAASSVPFIGLCHSVQGTSRQIAEFLEVPHEELAYEAAGINHMSWITRLEHQGEDLYPRLRQLVAELDTGDQAASEAGSGQTFLGPARLDMLRRCGYVVTESSTHFPEYVPFYARTDEQIEQYRVPIDQHKRNMANKEQRLKEFLAEARQGRLPPLERSVEYGVAIMNAMVTGEPVKVYANVMNRGLVTNLPANAAVEVACLVDRSGVQPCYFGDLPTQLAAMCQMDISVHQLAVEAILERDRRRVYWALMMDPLTHSRLTIDQIEAVVDELVDGQQEYLGEYL